MCDAIRQQAWHLVARLVREMYSPRDSQPELPAPADEAIALACSQWSSSRVQYSENALLKVPAGVVRQAYVTSSLKSQRSTSPPRRKSKAAASDDQTSRTVHQSTTTATIRACYSGPRCACFEVVLLFGNWQLTISCSVHWCSWFQLAACSREVASKEPWILISLGLGASHLCANNNKHQYVQAPRVYVIVLFDLNVMSLWCVCVRGTRRRLHACILPRSVHACERLRRMRPPSPSARERVLSQ